jgi:ATP-binding cassette subfamily F protein 3
LSGGERNRYALARMLLAPSNFLLLDEPTNHLDLQAKDVLLEALQKFTGTVVFVSHDRYFIDNLATRVFEIEEGHVHVYPGNYEDYLWRKSGGSSPVVSNETSVAAMEPVLPPASAEPKKRVNPMKVEKLKTRLREVEQRVAELESEIRHHEASLADFKSAEETIRITAALEARRKDLEQSVAKWEELSAQMETPA